MKKVNPLFESPSRASSQYPQLWLFAKYRQEISMRNNCKYLLFKKLEYRWSCHWLIHWDTMFKNHHKHCARLWCFRFPDVRWVIKNSKLRLKFPNQTIYINMNLISGQSFTWGFYGAWLCGANNLLYLTRSVEARWAPTSSWRPFGPLDFLLRALRALRPSDPRVGELIVF